MKNRIAYLACLALMVFTLCDANAQQRFKAGVVAGLNASQILGDDVGGYNRLGLQGGLRAIAVLSEKSDLNIELLYSQRGSREADGSPTCFNFESLDIALQYIEVPVMLTYKDWLHEEDGYYKIQVSGGLTYSRLISASSDGSCHDAQDENFSENDYGFTIGAEYFGSEHLSFGIRWSRSFNLLYDKDKNNPGINSLRGYFLSFRTAYIF